MPDNAALIPFFEAAAAPPPPPTESHTFTLNAQTINAAAAGVFTNLNEEFTLGGTAYIITGLFTHDNGVQFRMGRRLANTNIIADNSVAQAFIAANLLVDVDIAPQPAFRSSVMENVSGISAAQYRAFPGRFQGGTSYTITIST